MRKTDKEMLPEDSHTCTICNTIYTEAEGGVEGDFGPNEVCFCPWCYSSCVDMVFQIEGLTKLQVPND